MNPQTVLPVNVQRRTRDAVASGLGASAAELCGDTRLDAYAIWDSLTALTLLIELESKVNVSVDPVALFHCQTVADIENVVSAALSNGNAAASGQPA